MTERDRKETEASRQGIGAALARMRSHRAGLLTWVLVVMAIFGVYGSGSTFALFLNQETWPALGFSIAALLATLSLIWGYRMVRQARLMRASRLILVFLVLQLLIQVLAFQGIGVYVAAAGCLMLLVVGTLVLPDERLTWLLAMGLLLALTGMVEWLNPLPRYDLSSIASGGMGVPTFLFAIATFFILSLIFVGLRFLEFQTIRLRLLISFALVALAPGLLVAGASVVVGLRSSRQRILTELDNTATIRASDIEDWVGDLRVDLEGLLSLEAFSLRNLLESRPESLDYEFIYAQEKRRITESVELRQSFDVVFLTDAQGRIMLSTDAETEGLRVREFPFFVQGQVALSVLPFAYSPVLGEEALSVSMPLEDSEGDIIGVLVGQAGRDRIRRIVGDRMGLGELVDVYLVDGHYRPLASTRSALPDYTIRSEGIRRILSTKETTQGVFTSYRGETVLGHYEWLPLLQSALVIEADTTQALRTTLTMVGFNVTITLLSVVIAAVGSVFIARSIARPLDEVSEAATEIADGHLDRRVPVNREDEVGKMAMAFNDMTRQLRSLVGGLEARVAERTAVLEHRTSQLEAAAQVSRQAASIRDVDGLLDVVAEQVAARFGFYHVGIYLVNEAGTSAVLRASSPGGGETLVAQGFRVDVGGASIVGQVSASGRPHRVTDVREDDFYLAVADLPETRSEVTLPLVARGDVIGVLDVQSSQEEAFSPEDVTYLQTMADQIALSIENARLLREAESRVQEISRLLRAQREEGWQALAAHDEIHSYVYDGFDAHRRGDNHGGGVQEPDLVIPVGEADNPLARFKVLARSGRDFESSDIELARAIATEAGRALESARLFNETQSTLQEANILYQGSRALVETRRADELFQVLVDIVMDPALDRSLLLMVDRDQTTEAPVFRVEASWDAETETLRYRPGTAWQSDDRAALDADEPEIVVVPDVTRDTTLDPHSRQMLSEMGARSLLAAPLMGGTELMGWFVVYSVYETYHFSDQEIRLYRGLSSQAATMLRNFELLEMATDRAERERLLADISTRMRETLDMDLILQTALQEIGANLGLPDIEVQMQSKGSLS